MLPSKIFLVDRATALVKAWRNAFSGVTEVEVIEGDYFQKSADAMVSPANSFGIMDGGLDLAIRDQLGHKVEARIQEVIVARHHGELPIGSAEIVATDDSRWRYMISAPTMRVPEPIPMTLNVYMAFRAILVAVENFNKGLGKREIDSIVCCGLGTGIGRVEPKKCANQMRAAYRMMKEPSMIPSFEAIHRFHRALVSL